MEIKIGLLFLNLLIGCKYPNGYLNNVQIDQVSIDTIVGEPFYNLNYIDSNSYIIEWGTSNFKNTSKDTFQVLGNGSLGIVEANNKYLVLNQPCGTSCALYVILPLKLNKPEITFWNSIYSNLDHETIVTTIDPSLGSFKIINYEKNIEQEIVLEDLCPAAEKSMCIDSIYIEKGEIYIKYQGSKWQNDKPDNKVKSILLK